MRTQDLFYVTTKFIAMETLFMADREDALALKGIKCANKNCIRSQEAQPKWKGKN